MFRILYSLIWIILIAIPLIWLFNNNGWINIIWLGMEVKINIMTFLIALIFAIGILFFIYRFFRFIISLFLGLFGIFKTNELKKRDRVIKKYEEIIALIISYFKAVNSNNIKEAKFKQKQIYSLSKNNALKEVLIEQTNKPQPIIEVEENKNNKGILSSLKNIFTKQNS